MDSKELACLICKTLDDKKGENIVYINVADKTVLADYMIIATGRSSTHVKSLCDYVEEEVEKAGLTATRKEGVNEGRWAVLDFGDVLLHVFDNSSRDFYHLERLWGEGAVYDEKTGVK